ncbi:MAG: FeoA domain-containing protein [Spirochaetales bacterium]|nr:FeoA domain-containing protein [Spirochaetales bacterium]
MAVLGDLRPEQRGRVTGYREDSQKYRSKLFSMGLTRGTVFTVKRIAPLGDPVEIEVRGSMMSLRKREAEALVIEEVSE